MGPGWLLREEERQAGSRPAPLHTRTRSRGHTHWGGREERCGEEVLQEGDWSLAPWGAGGREKDGERAGERGEGLGRRPGGMQGEWEAEGVLVSGWKELKCRSDPVANVLWPVPPPVRQGCWVCSAASYPLVCGGPTSSRNPAFSPLHLPPLSAPGQAQLPLPLARGPPASSALSLHGKRWGSAFPREHLRAPGLAEGTGPFRSSVLGLCEGPGAASPCARAPFRGGCGVSLCRRPPDPTPGCLLWKHREWGPFRGRPAAEASAAGRLGPETPGAKDKVTLTSVLNKEQTEKLSGHHTPPRASLVDGLCL